MGDFGGSKLTALKHSLKGSSIRIPDLHAILRDMPSGTNCSIDLIRRDVEQRLEQLFSQGKRLEKLKRADAGGFGAAWWPYACYDAFRTCTYLGLWLFIWDDECDSLEFSDLVNNLDRGRRFRTETIRYCRQCLGLLKPGESLFTPTNPIITNFKDVGDALVQSCSLGQRSWLMDEIEHFVRLVEQEQISYLSNCTPSVQEYRHRRMGTSAVSVCLVITDYAYDFELPKWITCDIEFKRIFDATNVIISTTNDILSLKKEINAGQIDSLIPLLYLECQDVQKAVDQTTSMVEEAVYSFHESAERLLTLAGMDKALREMLQKMIDGCQYACTGNLAWSITSGRYLLDCQSLEGGVEITL
ncbi:terpenoid synthase [Viridothelium virens]|uniref:Terpene synthase n=1 Tax=Viridothelium virens TaxID=1048519 RepID=A0A6A6HD71_VIRVR|nr:terpenoid synthase [Viridothelium virens]